MKTKIISALILSVILFSCASKTTTTKSATVTETKTKTVELTSELLAGKNLYENNCSKCHKLFSPTDFSQVQWKPILVSMQKKAKLSDTQMVGISNYINSQL